MKRRPINYTFVPGGAGVGTITFTDFTAISLDGVALIVNVTDGIIIFNLADPAKTGTVATNVLTLALSTTGMSSGDALMIVYDEGDAAEEVITAEYNTTGAQTNDPIIDSISAGTEIVITEIDATCDNANTNDTGLRIGFGAATVPAEGASGAAAVPGVVLSHPGIAAGSGIVRGTGAGKVGQGASGEELRITNEDPGGKLRVVVTYYLKAS